MLIQNYQTGKLIKFSTAHPSTVKRLFARTKQLSAGHQKTPSPTNLSDEILISSDHITINPGVDISPSLIYNYSK
jgi:hypothetical protein